MPLHDLLAGRQSDSRPGKFLSVVKPPEDQEDLFGMLRRNPDAIVPDGKYRFVLLTSEGAKGSLRNN